MRCTKIALMFSLVLGLSQGLFAAVADWSEEMTTTVGASPKGWTNLEGNWGSTVTPTGDTWINTTNNGNIGTGDNPTVNQTKYTIEYRFRFINDGGVPTGGSDLITGAWFYNPGDTAATDPVARTRHQIGYIPGGADLNFEVVGAGDNRHNNEDLNGGTDPFWLKDEWQVIRINFDDTAGPSAMSMYLNGALVKTVSHQDGNSLLVGQDDPGLYFGAQDGGTVVDTEWDYIRIKVGEVVPISEALNAVPEPSSFVMLGLAGLALLRRRS